MSVINIVRRISSKCIQTPVPFHLVPYDEQYETRDFISTTQRVNYDNIINYYETEAFKNYKPNLKSYYE